MLKNYLLVAIRNFRRHRSSFVINLLGLSAGLTCSILILLWVMDEVRVDQFHDNKEKIYNVMEFQTYADGIMTTTSTPGVLAPALKEEIPEIEYACTMTWPDEAQLTYGEKKLRLSGRYADPDVLKIFTFPLLHGDPETALDDPTSIVIGRETAMKLFGRDNVLGETIKYLSEEEVQYKITGVLDDVPEQSTLEFEFIIPFEVFRRDNPWTNEWGNNGPRTYISVHDGVVEKQLEEKIKFFIGTKKDESTIELFLLPFKDYYLNGRFENGKPAGGRITYVKIFTIIAAFILIIACINFMNLSTARSARRAKEVGIRKTLGAERGGLIGQFLGESLVISFSSLLVSLVFVSLVLPYFNELTDKTIKISVLAEPIFIVGLFIITLFTGLLSGSYPAFYLSSFSPIKVLKGKANIKVGEVFIRKGLVIFQYTLSIALIIATAVIYLQVNYIQNKNLGYDQDNLLYFMIEGKLNKNFELLGEDLKKIPNVKGVAVSSHALQGRNNNSGGVEWPGKDPDTQILFEMVGTDHQFQELLDFEILNGRYFSPEFSTDSDAVVINEKALEIMKLKDPIGTTISFWQDDWKIVGVLKDFHFSSMRAEIAPMIIRYDPNFAWFFFVKLTGQDIASTIDHVEQIYNSHNPGYVFDYGFLDEHYAQLYASETRVGKLAGYFGLFAILISCLGLFGLSAFTAERKTKEIGIRKTYGASFSNIIYLLSKDFTKLILLAILISTPLAFYLMDEWLLDYKYRIELSWWIFVLAGILSMLVAWATISFQSIKAATQNPVESLKVED